MYDYTLCYYVFIYTYTWYVYTYTIKYITFYVYILCMHACMHACICMCLRITYLYEPVYYIHIEREARSLQRGRRAPGGRGGDATSAADRL